MSATKQYTMATNEIDQMSGVSNSYSIPQKTKAIFDNGILNNPLIAPILPAEIVECAKIVRFVSTSLPSIPINWRLAESVSALKGLEAAMINVLLKRKYGLEPQEAIVNTDHAQLFFLSMLFNTIDPDGENIDFSAMLTSSGKATYEKYFKDCDLHGLSNNSLSAPATNIYQCKDGRYFHLHGSMNNKPTQDMLGLPNSETTKPSTGEEEWTLYQEMMAKKDSEEWQRLASDVYKQAGTICWTADEYQESEHGRANSHVGLYEIHEVKSDSQPACWWPSTPCTSPARPLAGLKVVDLTRVIAAPAVTRGLAELGASVMRITAEHITDMSNLHLDMNWGKWNAHLDFRIPSNREKLRALVLEADVVVMGYRPGVLDKCGFSPSSLLNLMKDRERGLIVVRENCYGWHGPWAHRSGWQQISDACCGVSMEFGRAMGHDEPVTPVFPNSDFCTGIAGVVAVLDALCRRGEEGGSYRVDVSTPSHVKRRDRGCGLM